MQIPADKLSADVLKAIIEEYVLHEGTDYGHEEFTLEQKVEMVKGQLQSGKAVIMFDPEEETLFIRPAG